MEDPVKLNKLFEKYLRNACTAQEVEDLMHYFHSDNRVNLEKLILQEFENRENDNEAFPALRNEIFYGIKPRITPMEPKRNIFSIWSKVISAAVVLLVIGVSIYFNKGRLNNSSSTNQHANVSAVVPGGEGATLTLSNGKKIHIQKIDQGALAEQSGVRITKTESGHILYEITDMESASIGYNTLSTSRGEQIQVILPDGSNVHLNSESTLTYPTRFTDASERNVTLAGEGYFEVVRNKTQPFVVKVKDQQIKVLGTSFNIQAYPENKTIKTTLATGLVLVKNKTSTLTLVPGEQSISSSLALSKRKVDIQSFLAWKDGVFAFNEENLADIMRRVSRWYNIDVVFVGADPSLRFGGSISRKEPLQKVLESLALTGKVSFELKERRLYVRP